MPFDLSLDAHAALNPRFVPYVMSLSDARILQSCRILAGCWGE